MFIIPLLVCQTATTQIKAISQGEPDSLHLNLQEVVLHASFVKDRQSPLRLTTIDNSIIEKKGSGITYPELIRDIPGVYATSETGSYGDAKINIRGFKQENISVLLNGIPISGLVTGNMFWNNWLGLTDATHSIQVQKGIGASMLSDNSVGGTINIITKSTAASASASGGMSATSYGLLKNYASFNSGQSKKGWAVSAMVSYAWGEAYPDATDVSSWAYMVNISKKINSRNSLLLTALGSPERHMQRSARLTNQEIEDYGLKYNKNWGYRNGKPLNLSENFYHKPYITLHHFFKAGANTELSSAAYVSVGNGGGRWSESKSKRVIQYRKESLIDWEAIVQENRENEGYSTNILSDYLAGHTQTGLKSNLSHMLNEKLELTAGLHYQYYTTWEKERITDLLGGDYWYEDYETNSIAGLAGRNPVKRVGDYVRTYNGRITNHLTLYTTANYKSPKWDIRLGISSMGTASQRWDKYNYITDYHSDIARGTGYSVKGGITRKISMASLIYANAGVYSRVPYSNIFFSSGNNNITDNVKNEKNFLTEIGFRHLFDRGSFEITAYRAYWQNKSIISNPYKQPDETNLRYIISGLDALHQGIEVNANYNPSRAVSLSAYASFGNWNWKNDVSANIYDEYSGLLKDVINVYSDGLPVGDSPQTQVAFFAQLNLGKGITLNADWRYHGNMYADFDPRDRQNPGDRSPSFKIPGYSITSVGVYKTKTIGKLNTTIYATVDNLFNKKYIERGRDGSDHTLDTFSGFWGAGINGSAGLRVNL